MFNFHGHFLSCANSIIKTIEGRIISIVSSYVLIKERKKIVTSSHKRSLKINLKSTMDSVCDLNTCCACANLVTLNIAVPIRWPNLAFASADTAQTNGIVKNCYKKKNVCFCNMYALFKCFVDANTFSWPQFRDRFHHLKCLGIYFSNFLFVLQFLLLIFVKTKLFLIFVYLLLFTDRVVVNSVLVFKLTGDLWVDE